MIERYYQDELEYLRDLGEEFGEAFPDRARFLHRHAQDPDVEQLLQGFAFLTARVRQRLDDELPELTHTLLGLLYPHFLRPLPAATIVKFEPKASVVARQRIERHTPLGSEPCDGTTCLFRTCYPVDLLPIRIDSVMLRREPDERGQLSITIESLFDVNLADQDLGTIRLYLAGEDEIARTLLALLLVHVERLDVVYEGPDGERIVSIPREDAIRSVGFETEWSSDDGPDTSLLPFPARSFDGYRLLQEYFFFPTKFHFVDVVLDPIRAALRSAGQVRRIELRFPFREAPDLPTIDERRIQLHCTPALNLFPHDGDPIIVDHRRTEYRIRASGDDPAHYEIHSVEAVHRADPTVARLPTLYSFDFAVPASDAATVCYETVLRPGVTEGNTTETYLRFTLSPGDRVRLNGGQSLSALLPTSEVISIDLMCTNRDLPSRLMPGTVNRPVAGSPDFATFDNIGRVVRTVSPPLDDGLQWRLVSHLSLNYLSLSGVRELRGLLGIYDFQSARDEQMRRRGRRRLEGIVDVRSSVTDDVLDGAPVRVVETMLDLDEQKFEGPGDVFLFSAVLDRFLALYVSANAFSRLKVKTLGTERTLEFNTREGVEIVL